MRPRARCASWLTGARSWTIADLTHPATRFADEHDVEAGVAHVHEHMLFKGTARRGVGQIAAEVESSGGQINAFTTSDHTVYHLVLAGRYFATGLDILADALRDMMRG